MGQFLTPYEVASILKIRPVTVYWWIRTGRIEAKKVPNSSYPYGVWMIELDDIPIRPVKV